MRFARRWRPGLDHDVVVLIRGGTYPQTQTLVFGPEDSGTEKHSITYAAAPGEKVVLSGGRTITGWKRGAGAIWTAELPEVKAGKWYFRQLFVDGRRAIRARTPNAGQWWTLKPRAGNRDANDATITLGVDHPIRGVEEHYGCGSELADQQRRHAEAAGQRPRSG